MQCLVPGLLLLSQVGSLGRPLTIDDLARIATPTGTAVAPDGRAVAYSRIRQNPGTDRYRESVWLVDGTGGPPRELVASGRTPRWAPAGDAVAYLAPGDSGSQIWVIRPDGSARRVLTRHRGGVRDFAWAPEGGRIAFVGAGTPGDALFVLDLATGRTRALTDGTGTLIVHPWDPGANLSWSPDGTEIAFSRKPTPAFDDDYRSDVWVVRVADGVERRVVGRSGMDMRPVWSPDGRHIAFRSSFGMVDRFANHGLAIVDLGDGSINDAGRRLEAGFLDGPWNYAWSQAGDALYFTAAEPLGGGVYRLDLASSAITLLSGPPALRAVSSFAPRAGVVAFVMSTPGVPWEVYRSSLADWRPERLTHSNPQLDGVVLGGFREVQWAAGDWTLHGVLVTPPAFDSARRYPVITILHGGPEGQAAFGFGPDLPSPVFSYEPGMYPVHLLAANGFVVFLPNFRGSGGAGERLRRAGSVDWSRTFLADIQAGVDTLIGRGIADSTRLFLAGSRSGATKVVSVLTNSGRFRAAYVHQPYPDLVADYGGGDFHLQNDGLFGGSPTTAREAYARHSPINHADRITTPLLIVADEDAFYIQAEQSMALHQRLWSRGVPGELLVYRGRGVRETTELLRHMLAWFQAYADPWPGSLALPLRAPP